jgi:hypothetical protein
MMKTIRIYAWSTAVLFALASLVIRRIAMELKAYMDSLKHSAVAYPPLSEVGFAVTPWLGVLPVTLACILTVAHIRKLNDRLIVHAWGSTSLIFLAGLLLAFVAYTIPWIPVVSRMEP